MTKHDIIAALRRANPTASVYALWVDYDASEDGKRRWIAWPYFQAVCREVDRASLPPRAAGAG